MSAFVHPALLVGLWIVAIPIVIHLINMFRHRRVQWAAMEFLLVSQKKNRTWVIFKQLLLLLTRMAVVALLVLMLAQPLLRNEFGHLFGNMKTHHIVLLDDSFSMSDRWADTSAFAEAKEAVRRIGDAAARQRQPQTFTLLRFSRVSQVAGRTQLDFLKEPVSAEFSGRIDGMLQRLQTSQTAARAVHALEAVNEWLGSAQDERQIVYIISDFRTGEWDEPTELQTHLAELNRREAEIHLVNCVDRTRSNLAIASLKPTEGIRARDVPWMMEVAVRNFGPTTAKNVPVLLEEDGHGRPSVTVAEIPPGKTVTERFQVRFRTAGDHRIAARLEGDAVEADNSRFAAVGLPAEVPVLLIDQPDARSARYIAAASAPGGPVRTGIRPQIETPSYLARQPLDKYHAIILTNIERLDPPAIDALEAYLRAGGGVALFLGGQSDHQTINAQWYRDGDGFFPVPLSEATSLMVDRLTRAPDLQPAEHPIFRILAGERNSFVATVLVQRYYGVPEDWAPASDSTTQVIARLRNGAPLVVEQRVGDGRVVAFLTSAAPTWNNWARNPSFVVAVQDLYAYLAHDGSTPVDRPVGASLELSLNTEEYRRRVRFDVPKMHSEEAPTEAAFTDATLTPDGSLAVSFAETDAAGFYQADLTRTDGAEEQRLFAVNVDAAEGDLNTVSGPQLATRLGDVKYNYVQASSFQYTVSEMAGYNVSQWLLYLLVAMLIGEQILAYFTSYHPPARTKAAAGGGVP